MPRHSGFSLPKLVIGLEPPLVLHGAVIVTGDLLIFSNQELPLRSRPISSCGLRIVCMSRSGPGDEPIPPAPWVWQCQP
jgi:hypothetical protein